MKPPVEAPTSRQSAPGGVDAERVERVRELLAAARDEPRRPLDLELDRLVHLLPGLVVARHEPGEHERLRLRAALREAALHEQDVEPLLHRAGRLAAMREERDRTSAGHELVESRARTTPRA